MLITADLPTLAPPSYPALDGERPTLVPPSYSALEQEVYAYLDGETKEAD